jgi:hypothetical protein
MFKEYKSHKALLDVRLLLLNKEVKIKKYKTSVYFGIFVNYKRYGKGIMIYENLRIYEGDWENDLKHG